MRFGAGAGGDVPSSGWYDAPIGPQPLAVQGAEYGPVQPSMFIDPISGISMDVPAFLDRYKWWLIGAGAGFLLAGGSILGLSLRRRRKKRSRR